MSLRMTVKTCSGKPMSYDIDTNVINVPKKFDYGTMSYYQVFGLYKFSRMKFLFCDEIQLSMNKHNYG